MGYTTRFKGVLKFGNEPTVAQLRKLESMLGEKVPGASYCQFSVTKDYAGLEWDRGEKFYDADKAAQYVIDEMRKEFPNFELHGDLVAQGESTDDVWILRADGNKAFRVEIELKGFKVTCPDCGRCFRTEEP